MIVHCPNQHSTYSTFNVQLFILSSAVVYSADTHDVMAFLSPLRLVHYIASYFKLYHLARAFLQVSSIFVQRLFDTGRSKKTLVPPEGRTAYQ